MNMKVSDIKVATKSILICWKARTLIHQFSLKVCHYGICKKLFNQKMVSKFGFLVKKYAYTKNFTLAALAERFLWSFK